MTHKTITLEPPFAFGDTVANAEGDLGKIEVTNYENGTLFVRWLKDDEAEILPMSSVSLKAKAKASRGVLFAS